VGSAREPESRACHSLIKLQRTCVSEVLFPCPFLCPLSNILYDRLKERVSVARGREREFAVSVPPEQHVIGSFEGAGIWRERKRETLLTLSRSSIGTMGKLVSLLGPRSLRYTD
jgi:hypothetical protein